MNWVGVLITPPVSICSLKKRWVLFWGVACHLLLLASIAWTTPEQCSSLNTTTMETTVERLISLLFDKEAEIKELNELLIQMNEKLQAVQNEYAKLYKLYLGLKNKKVKVIKEKIGYKTKGGEK